MASRGMMAENMFISKSQLLGWLNSNLQLRLEKVEDTCSGAVACQLMDILHPGSISMKKVDFNARAEYQWEVNYKELQVAFDKAGLTKHIPMGALMKGKFQDNNEFMQWFKGYWDSIIGDQEITDYDAIARRQTSKSGDWKRFSLGETGARPAGGDTIPAVRARGAAAPAPPRAGGPASKAPLVRASRPAGGPPSRTASSASAEAAAAAHAQVEELTETVTELKLKVETAERERDFYFDKLRDIEVLTQAPELADIPIVKIVEKILYAADSEEAKAAMAEAAAQYGANFDAAPANDAPTAEPAEVAAQ